MILTVINWIGSAAQGYGSIDFSNHMTQLLGPLVNLNLMGGFNVVAACSDNWRQSMRANLTSHDDRLSKLG